MYRAQRRDSGELVALKMLASTSLTDFVQLADRARAFVGLRHGSLMEQRETFVGCALTPAPGQIGAGDFDVPYSVATWVDGVPLTEAVETASVGDKLGWIVDLAEGLAFLHSTAGPGAPNGIVHRDVKPSNIRIASDGRAVLLDFGVARPVDASDMTQGIGTYLWRAPEVLAGNSMPGTPSDVWGVGAVAHWVFVGEALSLDGSNAARERIECSRDIAGLADAPAVAAHLARLVRSSPADRPEDLHAWALQLRRLGARRRSLTRARRSAIVAGVLAVLLLAGFGIVRVVEEFSGPPGVTVPPRSSTTAAVGVIVPTGGELVCRGRANADIVSDPPLSNDVRDVRFRMDGETGEVRCESPEGKVLTAKLTALSVSFAQINCASLLGSGVVGVGDATVAWSNDVTGRAAARVTFEAGQAQLHLDIATPGGQLSGDAPLLVYSGESTCDDGGIDQVNVRMDQLTLRSPAAR